MSSKVNAMLAAQKRIAEAKKIALAAEEQIKADEK